MTVLLLVALQVTQVSATDTVVAAARRAVEAFTDTAAVRAAGYGPTEEIGILDPPFQGQHWWSPMRVDTLPDVPLDRPAFIMFGLINGELRRVGVAYATRMCLDAPLPDGLGGDAAAAWHQHYWCREAGAGARRCGLRCGAGDGSRRRSRQRTRDDVGLRVRAAPARLLRAAGCADSPGRPDQATVVPIRVRER